MSALPTSYISYISYTAWFRQMSAASADWNDCYRPQTYEEVRGQTETCRFLGALTAREKKRRNILLFGDVGSGKTSLARIHARALNCASPNPKTGSPCLACKQCAGEPDNLFEYDVPLRGGGVVEIAWFLDLHYGAGRVGRPHVLFFDEAQSIEAKACLYLLKRIEAAQIDPFGPVFIFATTAPEKLSSALRSRLKRLHVSALELDDAHGLLAYVAEKEGLRVEDGAFDLVIRYAGRQPRDLIGALDVVTDRNKGLVSVADAKEAFGYDQVDDLEDYFIALGDGDWPKMVGIFNSWRLPIGQRVEWIEAYLSSFYIRTIKGSKAPCDPVVDTLTTGRQRVANAFIRRLKLTSLDDLAPTWRAMMAFWADGTIRRSDANYGLEVALFHDRIMAANWVAPLPTTTGPRKTSSHIEVECSVDEPHSRDGYLTAENVRNIVNASSFLIQRTGRQLNLLIKVHPQNSGDTTDVVAVDRVDGIVSELEKTLYQIDPVASFAALRLVENTSHGPIGFVAASVSDPFHPDDPSLSILSRIESWARSRKNLDVLVGAQEKSLTNSVHWGIVQQLLAGFTSSDSEWGDKLLKSGLAPKVYRYPTSLNVAHVRYWGEANPSRTPDEVGGSNPLSSKLDAELFEEVRSGWELLAFRRRSFSAS